MRAILSASAMAGLLAACVPAGGAEELPARPPTSQCDASGVQDHKGHRASAAAGQTLLQLTGATTLRWVPPNTAVTMDYRADRMTVSYDDEMVIETISCG